LSEPNISNMTPAAPSTRPALSRLNIALLAIALLQILLVAVNYWPRNRNTIANTPLLSAFEPAQVTRFAVADDTGREVALERTGSTWVLADTDGFPANAEKIDDTLTKIARLGRNRIVAQTVAAHRQLQVTEDGYSRRIALTTPSGTSILYLGSSAGAGATHLRLQGEDITYLTGELASWELDAQPSSWINAQYFSIAPTDVQTVTLQNPAGLLTFVRDEAQNWTLSDLAPNETANPSAISAFVNRATSINLLQVLGKDLLPGYGMDTPTAVLTLSTNNSTGDNTTHTLTLGAPAEEGRYFFKSNVSDFYVTISTFTADEFIEKQRSDFLALPASANEATTPAPGVELPVQTVPPDSLNDLEDRNVEAVAPESGEAQVDDTTEPVSPTTTPAN
jgi:hypothetical protein